MLTKIVQQLKTGRIQNVTYFGSGEQFQKPYVVVKQEKDGLDRGTIFRVITHFDQGQHEFQEDYTKGDVLTLLNNFKDTTRKGNYNQLSVEDYNDYPDTGIMEILFLCPHPLLSNL